MTNGEIMGVAGLGITVISNVAALVWGAAKMSAKVGNLDEGLKGIRSDFKEFLRRHDELEDLMSVHHTSIELLKQSTGRTEDA